MATVNMLTYMKNVGRSLGYSAIDTLKAYNPTVVAAADTAKTYTTDLYHAVKDFNASLKEKKDANESTLMGDVKDTLKDTWNNTKADLLSGNLYNKQRIKAGEEEMMKSMFGDLDFNFDDDFGDFDFDDDLEDTGEDKIVSAEMESAKAIVTGADMIGAKMSGSINSTTVAVGDHIAKSQERSSKAIYSLTERGFGQVSVGIAAVNSNLTILSALAEPLNLHMQNSATFYAKSTEFQNKMLEMMEKVVKNTDDGSDKRSRYSSSSTANRITDLITADGVIDLKAYSEMVMKNIRNYTDIAKDMIEMMGGVKNAGKMVSSSPISLMLNFGMKKMMPQLMKDTMENFNKMLADFIPVALDKLRTAKLPGVLDLFKDLLLPEVGVKNTIDPSKYEKGKIPWDGIAKKSITDVIPEHLARIEMALTGKEVKMFNYKTGRWQYSVKTKKAYRDILSRAAKYSSDMAYEFDSVLRGLEQKGKITSKQKENMSEALVDFIIKAATSGNTDYMDFMKDDFDPTKYGMPKEVHKIIKDMIRIKESKGDYRMRANFMAGIPKARDEINRSMQNEQEFGEEGIASLWNGSVITDLKESINRSNSFILDAKDEYDHNLFFYLQGIYLHTKHVSDNLGNLSVRGGKVRGARINKNDKIKPIDTLSINVKDGDKEVEPAKPINASKSGALMGKYNRLKEAESLQELANIMDSSASFIDNNIPKDKELRNYQILKSNYTGSNWKDSSDYDEEKEKKLNAFLKGREARSKIESILDKSDILSNSEIGKAIVKFLKSMSKPGEIITEKITGLFNAAGKSITNKLFGEDEEGGILDYLRDIKGSLRMFLKSMASKLKFKLFGTKDENGNFDNGKFFGRMFNETKESLKNVGSYIKNKFSFAGGGRVTKTGLATLHEGEYVIPTGNGTLDDFIDEMVAAGRGTVAEGESEKERRKRLKDEYKYKTGEKMSSRRRAMYDNMDARNAKEFISDSMYKLFTGITYTIKEIVGDPAKDKEKIQETMGKVKDKFTKIFGEGGEGGLGGMGAGAVVGGGLSILTGSIVNPLLGASIGAAVGLVKQSKTVQELLFGKEENRTDIQKAMAKFFTDNLPDTAIGAGIGGLAGTLFMGSPLLGTILGAGVGFAESSDKVKHYLFGEPDIDNGIISKELQNKIKKALPNIGAGAIAGLIAGPFGIVGNLLVGSALGYVTSTEQFKDWFFGKDDGTGKRVGGVTQILRENIAAVRKDIVKPLLGIFDKLAEEFRQGFRDMTFKIRDVVADIGKNLIISLRSSATFKALMESRPIRGIKSIGGKLIKAPYNLVTGALKGANERLQARALLRGYRVKDSEGNFMDTAARKAEAKALGLDADEYRRSEGGTIDAYLSRMSAEQLKGLQGDLESVKRGKDEARLKNERTMILIRLRDQLRNYIGSNKPMADEVENMIADATESGDFSVLQTWVDNQPGLSEAHKRSITATITAAQAAVENLNTRQKVVTRFKELMGNKSVSLDRLRERVEIETASKAKQESGLSEEKEKNDKAKVQEAITETIPSSIKEVTEAIKLLAISDPEERKKFANSTPSLKGLFGDRNGEEPEHKEGDKQANGSETEIFHNGEWVNEEDYKADLEFKKSITTNLPFLSGIKGAFSKIGELLSFSKEKGEKKKSVFEKLVDGLFGDGTENSPGLLGGLFSLFTGTKYTGLAGIGSTIKGVWSAIGGLPGIGTTLGLGALIFAGFSGVFDKLFNMIPGMGGGDNSSGGKTYGETATTTNGTEVHKDENGNWVDANGVVHSASEINIGSIQSQRVDTASFSERLWGSTIRGALTNTPSLAGLGLKLATKPGTLGGWTVGKIKPIATGVSNVLETTLKMNLIGKTFNYVCANMGFKLAPTLAKFGIPISTTENMFFELGETLSKNSDRFGKTILKGAGKETLEDVLKVAEIVWIAVDFMSGYEDARTTLGIIDEPTVGQRILSGLLRAVKNIIPIVGPMIPDSLVIDVFAKWLAPALGIDVSELTDARNRAQEELAAYNEATGSNITDVGEFNKKVLKDYSLTERIGNKFSTTFSKYKAAGSTVISNVQEKGLLGGVGASLASYGDAIGTSFLQAFKESDNIVAGIFNGIAEGIKTALPAYGDFIGLLPKFIGYASSGDIKGLWTDTLDEFEGGNESIEGTDLKTAVPGLFTRITGVLIHLPFRLVLTIPTLIAKVGLTVKDKLMEMITPAADAVKNFASDTIGDITDKIKSADPVGMLKDSVEKVKDSSVFSSIMSVTKMVSGVLSFPVSIMYSSAKKISEFLQPVINFGVKAAGQYVEVVKSNYEYMLKGDTAGMFSHLRATEMGDDGSEHAVFSVFQKLVGQATATILIPISDAIGFGRKTWEFIKPFGEVIPNAFNEAVNLVTSKSDYVAAGDLNGLWESSYFDEEGNPLSVWTAIANTGISTILSIPTLGIAAGHWISDKFDVLKEKVKSGVTDISTVFESKSEYVSTGNIAGLWGMGEKDKSEDDSPVSGWMKAVNFGANLILSVPTIAADVGNVLAKDVAARYNAFSNNKTAFEEYQKSLADIAVKDGAWEMIKTPVNTYDENDPLSGVWTIGDWISKIFIAVFGLFDTIMEKLTPYVDKIKEKAGDAAEAAHDIKEGAKEWWNNTWDKADKLLLGTGSRLAGKGFVSQTDPRYAGMRMGNGESVAEAGCAPAVASMVSQYYGKPMSMQQAINRSSAFQTPDGTTIDYFGNALSGGSTINTAPIGDTNGVMNNLASGNPVIMLGQDGRNTSKSNSPFGPGSHYVLGTGLDRSGNIIVNDPEQNGPRSYSPAILGSLRSAIGTSGGSSRMKNMKITPIKVRLSAGRGSVQARKPEIWSWLHAKAGFNDIQAAAIMGCWECESGNSPKRIECDYLYNYDIDWDGVATDEGLDYYCVNKVFPKYKPGKINKDGYKHNGHYYPGLGLAGWTGGRCRDLVMYAKSKGRAWYDLETQLDFFMGELNNKYGKMYANLKACNNLADATEIFARGFEHGAFKKGTSHYNDRYRAAQTIYAQFTGQPFVDINGYDSASGGSMKVSAIDKLLQIAMAEEGYTEHNSEAHVQEMGGNGHDNWNKYGYLTGAPHDMWCASYVSWVYDKLVDGDKNKFAALLGGGPSASCATLRNNAMNAGLYTDKPSVGDVVIFGTKGSRPASHTGIVTGVNPDGTYDLINGNASDAVRVAKNRSTNKNVANGNQYPDGFIHPRWSEVFPGMVDSYSNPYGNSFTSAMASAGASMASSSGNVLSDITGVFSTVLSNIFNAGRNQSSDASSMYSDYSGYNSYSDYSSYYSDYSTLDDYSKDNSGSKYDAGDYHNAYETKVLEGQKTNGKWSWDNAQKGPKDTAQQYQWDAATTARQKALLLAKWNNRKLGTPLSDVAQANMSEQQIIDYYMNHSVAAGSGSGLARGRGSRRSNPYIANYATPSGRGSSTRYTYAGRGPESMPAGNTTIINPGNMDKTTAMLLKTIITCIETVASNTSSINGIYEVLTEMAKRGGSTEAALAAIEAANANKNTQVDGALESLKATVDAILAS